MIEKSPEAFRTISEVADELDLPQHVLRFWETRFSQIKPLKRGGGRRYYRPEDVNLLKGIRFLLYGEGYTIKGVQRILKEQGVRHVAGVWIEEPSQESEAAPEEVDVTPVAPEPPVEPPPPPAVPPHVADEPTLPVADASAAAPKPAAAETPPPGPAVKPEAALSADKVRQLKAAMFELIECKRILDAAK